MKALTTVGDHEGGKHILEVYRVRVCTRCGHKACPCCGGTWCDLCLPGDDDEEETGFKTNPQCADDGECVYEEPDDEAIEQVSVQEFATQEEFDAACAAIPDGGA